MLRRLPALALAAAVLVPGGAALVARAQDRDARESHPGKVTLSADGEPLLSVLKRLCSSQGYNFVASDEALQHAGKISLSLTDVGFDDALEAICDAYGLEGRVRGLDAHPIVVIRMRATEPASARERLLAEERPSDDRPARDERPARANRFLEGSGVTPRLERSPEAPRPPEAPAPAPATAPVTSSVAAPAPARGPAAIAVGLVVGIGDETITIKEASGGNPREFVVPTVDEDAHRNEVLRGGLKHLKRGDRVALEFRVEGTRLVITNLVGGGKPPTETP